MIIHHFKILTETVSKRGATSRDVNYNKVSIIPTRERGEKIIERLRT